MRVPIKGDWRGMNPDALDAAIEADKTAGLTPAGVILSVGGTGSGATDPVAACIDVAEKHGLYTHVDAAWAGSAMICPEYRDVWAGPKKRTARTTASVAGGAVRLLCLEDPALWSALAIGLNTLKPTARKGLSM